MPSTVCSCPVASSITRSGGKSSSPIASSASSTESGSGPGRASAAHGGDRRWPRDAEPRDPCAVGGFHADVGLGAAELAGRLTELVRRAGRRCSGSDTRGDGSDGGGLLVLAAGDAVCSRRPAAASQVRRGPAPARAPRTSSWAARSRLLTCGERGQRLARPGRRRAATWDRRRGSARQSPSLMSVPITASSRSPFSRSARTPGSRRAGRRDQRPHRLRRPSGRPRSTRHAPADLDAVRAGEVADVLLVRVVAVLLRPVALERAHLRLEVPVPSTT